MSPRTLLESEQQQIAQKLGMQAFVSITDHDDIEAPSLLQVFNPSPMVPISLEWTVPFGVAYFHLGVHNLPAEKAAALSDRLLAFTRHASDFSLGELLEALHGYPGVLIVLNHPFWDIECIGQQRHDEALQNFLLDYGQWIHALEINGFRPWRENALTMALASEQRLPIISGGDRHGCQPNTTLNVTAVQTFDEFVAEVRDGLSEVILLPEYREPMVARIFESSAEILREYPNNPGGQQRWTERVFLRTEAEELRPLSRY